MAKMMGVDAADRPELDELEWDVAPERVLTQLDEREKELRQGSETR